MAQAIGSKAQVIFQEEAAFATRPTTPDAKKLHIVTCDIGLAVNQISTPILRGNRNPTRPVRGRKDVSGSIVTHLNPFQLPSFLKFLLGAVTTTDTNGAAPYTHVITIADTLPSFFLEKGFTDIGQYFQYDGCKINRASFSFRDEGFQEVTFDILGVRETVSATSFDTTPVDNGYQPFDGQHIATIEEGGAPIGIASVAELVVENALDDGVYVLGNSGERKYLPEGTVRVSGTLTALFENTTLYDKAVNSTETSLKIAFQKGTGDGTAGNEYLEFFVPELTYSPRSVAIEGAAGIMIELPFEAYYDNSVEASALQITVKNTEAAI